MTDELVSVGRYLRAYRYLAGLQAAEVAQRAGINQRRLYRIEQGIFLPRLSELVSICMALDTYLTGFRHLLADNGRQGYETGS
jgi:transcriptional regulator with XRE-family HTH domain